ncbi:MAG TPA: hypothetical protein VJ903_03890 [Clostridia bacterium]|nr:hypothetical protein [Clostridia bacterium]
MSGLFKDIMEGIFDEFRNVPTKPVEKTSNATGANTPRPAANKTVLEHHPARSTPYKTEKAYTTQSAGGEITEGCVEHYSERTVAIDETKEKETSFSFDLNNENLIKYIVMGDILKPKF